MAKLEFEAISRAERLDAAIAAALPSVSRRLARRLIADGAVFVDGVRCRTASRGLFPGARVVVHAEELPALDSPALPVIFENDELLVVNKPAGVHVNETETTPRRSLVDRLERGRPGLGRSERGASLPSEAREAMVLETPVAVVHRLDAGTTGVMVLAKTPATAEALSRMFRERLVQKTYVCVTAGCPPEGLIDAPIGSDRKRPRARAVQERGKVAESLVTVLSSVDGASAVKVVPRTGRTHQIRVHLAHVGTPLFGDLLYGGPGSLRIAEEVVRAARPLLHAARLVLPLPGLPECFEAPLPDDLAVLVPLGLALDAAYA